MKIGNREIGPDHPPYIVAELSGNHNGDIENLLRLIDEAKFAGADAVKLQTYEPNTITMDCDHEDFLLRGENSQWGVRNLYDLYREAHTPYAWHSTIFHYARNVRRIEIFSSVFDETAIALLEGLHTPCYKVASFELVDLP